MVDLSIIILSYNTQHVTRDCLQSLYKSLHTIKVEIIVIDNASSDGSVEMLTEYSQKISSGDISLKLILNKENVGYPKGNNIGLKAAQGRYILFLNSDILIDNVDFAKLIDYMDVKKDIGALTVQVNLPQNGIDPASHRGFPTPWNAFSYYSKLEGLTRLIPGLNRLFGGYHLTYKNLKEIHEIDAPAGAFLLTRKDIIDKLKGFDEEFFMYGEDLDLAYRIKELGYKIIYYPVYEITHLKHTSGLKKHDSAIQKRTRSYFYDAMKIFYRKHYEKYYPGLINKLIYLFIDLKAKV